jgi:hypothetical protein
MYSHFQSAGDEIGEDQGGVLYKSEDILGHLKTVKTVRKAGRGRYTQLKLGVNEEQDAQVKLGVNEKACGKNILRGYIGAV